MDAGCPAFALAIPREFEPAKPHAAPLLHILGACADTIAGTGSAAASTATGKAKSSSTASVPAYAATSSGGEAHETPPLAVPSAGEPVDALLASCGAPAQPEPMRMLRQEVQKRASEEPSLYPDVYAPLGDGGSSGAASSEVENGGQHCSGSGSSSGSCSGSSESKTRDGTTLDQSKAAAPVGEPVSKSVAGGAG